MRILVDMDSVLADLLPPLLAQYNEEYGDNKTPEDCKTWDLHVTCEKAGREVYKYIAEEGLFRNLDPVPGAIDGVGILTVRGHEVVLVSTSPPSSKTAAWEKQEWVKEHLPYLMRYPNKVIFAHQKHMVYGDVLLDDSPGNLEQMDRFGYAIPVAFAYPYNQDWYGVRVHDWSEFVEFVQWLEDDCALPEESKRKPRLLRDLWERDNAKD